MNFQSLKYSTNDVVKFLGFVLLISSMWYDLKTDFEVHKEEHKLLEYRLAELENKFVGQTSYRSVAVKPEEIGIKEERK